MKVKNYTLGLLCLCMLSSCLAEQHRESVSLNGEWGIAKTSGEMPECYNSTVVVPGLVDIAQPAIDTALAMYSDTTSWYWHKRNFDVKSQNFEKVDLKIFKAKYHTKVYINGKYVGENAYSFTPSYFNIKPYINPDGKNNEIVIGVGTKAQLADTIPDGTDYEKLRYIPGIYDNVEIILSNKPYIKNIQCVPNIKAEKLTVIAEFEVDAPVETLDLSYKVSELVSGNKTKSDNILLDVNMDGNIAVGSFDIDMKGCNFWSPEDPFLYKLHLSSGSDDVDVRFGMRTFEFDAEKKIALLNEKPYYLRGTNVCIFRFFEDPERAQLPWDNEWATTLHKRFKEVKWNSMRYCIGFPPERWYEICDSLGFLLQDEYPLWFKKDGVKSQHLAQEYERWMRERWNHPSVVIWDAQNELVSEETGLAIQKVRDLDLSDRAWENGWSAPQRATDPSEAHPYPLFPYKNPGFKEPEAGYKKTIMGSSPTEIGTRYAGNPIIINEYAWLWVNRDGTPTTLTDGVYDLLWDNKNITSEERLVIYARNLAMLTEFWRAHRKAAGVLQFCGLGYSRPVAPRGETSDNWIDLQNLTFQPAFLKYVKPSFAPVGLMIDTWEKSYQAGAEIEIPLYVINDLPVEFIAQVDIHLMKGEAILSSQKLNANIEPFQVGVKSFKINLPTQSGDYQLKASYLDEGKEEVFSLRDLVLVNSKN